MLVKEVDVVMKVENRKEIENNFLPHKGKKTISLCFFLCIAVLSILAILSFNKSFSFSEFFIFLKNTSFLWIVLAFASVFLYIYFEGASILTICDAFGYKKKRKDGFFYSAADIYFSAITPSASGGQPASAYFMLKDGIPIPIITVALLYTLFMFSLSILLLDVIAFCLYPHLFFEFDFLAKLFIIIGFFVQLGLFFLFYTLLYKKNLLNRICSWFLKVFVKLHVVKDLEKKQEKLNQTMEKYQEASLLIKGKKGLLLRIFLFNLLQRIFQIGTIALVFLATGGKITDAILVSAIQSFVITGAYCVPIPGAIGVTDYLLLNGFKKVLSTSQAVHLELLTRGISFYCCILICGIAVIVKFWIQKRSSKK